MRNFLVPKWVKKYIQIYKERGFKALIKEAGWKVVVGVFLFYLVRDLILYVLIPYLIARGVMS